MMTVITFITVTGGSEPEWDAAVRERFDNARTRPGWVRGEILMPLDALDKRPGTIAITNLGSNFRDHNNIKAIAVNGVLPSSETVKSEKYKFYHEHSAITLGEPQGLAKRFLDYLNTTDGQKFLASRGAFGLR